MSTRLDAIGSTTGKVSLPTVSPPAQITRSAATGPRWRVGRKVPLNVYEGDRPICQCHTAADAARIVKAMNQEF